MARPGKLLRQFEELKQKQNQYFQQGKMVQALQLGSKIKDIKNQLLEIQKREEDRYYNQKLTLRDLLPKDEVERNNIHKMLVKVSLASDFLYDCLFDLKKKLSSMGIEVNSLSDEAQQLCKASNDLASKLLTDKAPQLGEVLLEDEPMLSKLHGIMDQYVKSTLEI